MNSSDVKIKDIDKIKAQKPINIFGKDVREINCFRNSFVYGISFGVVGGLASFLFTSKTLFSTNVGFASIWIGVFGYWFPCRYKYETAQLKMETFKQKLAKEKQKQKEKEKENISD